MFERKASTAAEWPLFGMPRSCLQSMIGCVDISGVSSRATDPQLVIQTLLANGFAPCDGNNVATYARVRRIKNVRFRHNISPHSKPITQSCDRSLVHSRIFDGVAAGIVHSAPILKLTRGVIISCR